MKRLEGRRNGYLGAGGNGASIEAPVCPECGCLLPEYDTEARHFHIERCRRLTVALAMIEPPQDWVIRIPADPAPLPSDRESE